MKKVTLGETSIMGLSVRTNNTNEMKPETGQIGGLYAKFGQQVMVNYDAGANLYGVYCHYESDHNGDFSVLVGSTPEALSTSATLESITLLAGDYLVFSSKGNMPQTVIDLWGVVWTYFESSDSKYKRAYTTDFERYIGMDEVEIYIAIQ